LMLDKHRLEAAAEIVAKKYGLTPEEAKTIQREAHGVYEYLGQDLAPDHKRTRTCKRDTIIEVVLDAGRLEQDLKDHKRMTPSMAAMFASRDPRHYEDLIDLVGPAFPYERYEVTGSEC